MCIDSLHVPRMPASRFWILIELHFIFVATKQEREDFSTEYARIRKQDLVRNDRYLCLSLIKSAKVKTYTSRSTKWHCSSLYNVSTKKNVKLWQGMCLGRLPKPRFHSKARCVYVSSLHEYISIIIPIFTYVCLFQYRWYSSFFSFLATFPRNWVNLMNNKSKWAL